MAHPPDVDSDLTYEEWITSIMDTPQRGMKLDFKNVDAVDPALAMLKGRKYHFSDFSPYSGVELRP